MAVRRLAVLFVILANFVEIVFVQLAHEAGKVAMLEVLGQDGLGEFLALDAQVSLTGATVRQDRRITSKTTKLSPSSPQRTIDA